MDSSPDWAESIRAARQVSGSVTRWEALAAEAEEAPDVVRALVYDGTGGAHLRQHWAGAGPDHLDAAIGWYRRAAAIARDPVATAVFSNLGRALESRYDDRYDDGDLDAAIDAYQQAGADLFLGRALRRRGHSGPDLDRAITLLSSAVEDADDPEPIRELAGALLDRHDTDGNGADLDRAVDLYRTAAATTDPEQLVAGCTGLANALLVRFQERGADDDLDQAIDLYEQVQPDAGDLSATAALARSNLAGALLARRDARGGPGDLDRAISLYDQASRCPDLSPRQHTGIMNNVAAALDDRFHARGALADLDEAVATYTDVVEQTPVTSPDLAGRLNNLAIALRTRHVYTVRLAPRLTDDLRESISRHREALAAGGDTPLRAALLNSLGNGLRTRFDATGDHDELREAITCFEDAVAAAPNDPAYLNNLSTALAALGETALLERAVTASRKAVALTVAGVAEYPRYLLNLANALAELGDRNDDAGLRAEATERYRESGRLALRALPGDALFGAANWSETAGAAQRWTEVVEAYRIGAAATAALVNVQVRRSDKESWLSMAQGIAARGTLALAGLGDARAAAVAAETGRAVLLSEALEVSRIRLERLADAGHGDLVTRYRDAAERTMPSLS
ncbi:tetratricopeptide repeat protein [Actinoplanes sp. NBC_00393]|uniref:hypothetical protein n=1 Tax=Actinoplanes sp. NBC_00393 TaxID=2975953 RepID=UPI002E1FA558